MFIKRDRHVTYLYISTSTVVWTHNIKEKVYKVLSSSTNIEKESYSSPSMALIEYLKIQYYININIIIYESFKNWETHVIVSQFKYFLMGFSIFERFTYYYINIYIILHFEISYNKL